jgi:sulfur relay (sulfurtransferase) complex TusBCD TusD component (DsrE family)
MNLAKPEGTHVRIFLMGDGVQCAVKGQDTL